MKCPVDGTALLMTERQGVEIDYCPTCRGVWLDRGELDKIIEKSTPSVVLPDPDPAPSPRAAPVALDEPNPRRDRSRKDDDDDDDDYRHGRRYKKKKRKSILGEIFDFDFD